MSKAVMISIRPNWCELITYGRKTIELRKNKPAMKTPFKVYIYCTKFKYGEIMRFSQDKTGKVIGEFVCDRIRDFQVLADGRINDYYQADLQYSCLKTSEISAYIGIGKVGYGWHISDLVIYDKPKELSDFFKMCPSFDVAFGSCWNCNAAVGEECECSLDGMIPLLKAPQSWCYVDGFMEKDGEG